MAIRLKRFSLHQVHNSRVQRRATLKTPKARLAELDHDIDDTIKQSPAWQVADDLLTSVPGAGDVTAHTLIADLPKRGQLTAVSLLSSMSHRSIVTLGRCAASEPLPVTALTFATLCTWQRSPQSDATPLDQRSRADRGKPSTAPPQVRQTPWLERGSRVPRRGDQGHQGARQAACTGCAAQGWSPVESSTS
jgi:hypothetical protein